MNGQTPADDKSHTKIRNVIILDYTDFQSKKTNLKIRNVNKNKYINKTQIKYTPICYMTDLKLKNDRSQT